MAIHKLAVGELYHPNRTSWPERPDLSVGPHGAELRLFFAAPTEKEVTAVRSGKAQFAWLAGDHAAMLCYRFADGIPWGDVTYHAAHEPPDRAGLPPAAGLACTVILIDAATGIIRGIRMVSWPDRAASALRTAIKEQIRNGYSSTAEQAWINALYSRYSGARGTADLVRDRADLTWTGGQHAQATDGTGADAYPPTHADQTANQAMGNPALTAAFGAYLVAGRAYPHRLPEELASWYCYLTDSGHSIAIIPESLFNTTGNLADLLCPAPVRTVLHVGWRIHDGFVVADIPYDSQVGLLAPEEDTEH